MVLRQNQEDFIPSADEYASITQIKTSTKEVKEALGEGWEGEDFLRVAQIQGIKLRSIGSNLIESESDSDDD